MVPALRSGKRSNVTVFVGLAASRVKLRLVLRPLVARMAIAPFSGQIPLTIFFNVLAMMDFQEILAK